MCEYCNGKKGMYCIDNESEMQGRICVDPDEKQLLVTVTNEYIERSFDFYSPDELVEEESLIIFEVKYCPMCGEKLGE